MSSIDNMSHIYKDMLGNPIAIGDFVAYAVVRSYRGVMNFGIVTAFSNVQDKWKSNANSVKVRLYEKEYDGSVASRNSSTTNFEDMVVVPMTSVPKEIADFLRSGEKRLESKKNESEGIQLGDLKDFVG